MVLVNKQITKVYNKGSLFLWPLNLLKMKHTLTDKQDYELKAAYRLLNKKNIS